MEPLEPSASITAPRSVLVNAEDGTTYVVPCELLHDFGEGGYRLTVRYAELVVPARSEGPLGAGGSAVATVIDVGGAGAPPDAALILPVLAETLVVSKRPTVIGRVRLTKRVHSREEAVEDTVQVERAEVERVAINRIVETAPAVRYEGDTLVVPVLEEVLVVEKRLMLREELRISKRQFEQRAHELVTVRSEEITVERFDRDGRKKPEPQG